MTVDGSDRSLAVGTQLWYVELGAGISRDEERDYDIDAVTVQGEVTFGGEPMEDAGGNPDWQLMFTDPSTGVEYAADDEGDSSYSVLLPVGTWDVYAAGRFDAHVLGFSDWPLASGVSVTRDATLDYDIDVVRLSGRLLVNGAAPEGDSTWSLVLVDTSTGERYRGDYVIGSSYDVPAPPGVYDVWVDGVTDNTVIGLADWPAEEGVTLARDTELDLDLEAFEVTGELTVDGAAMPDVTGNEDWRVSFTNVETGENYRHDVDGSTYRVWAPSGAYSAQVRGQSEYVPLSEDWWIAECVEIGR